MKFVILLLPFLVGCSTVEYSYDCFRVQGPITQHGASKEEAEFFVKTRDYGQNQTAFSNTSWRYECVEEVPAERLIKGNR